jgi:ABC-type nitrate/sulfonate/bicarbonate transport system permease component
MSVQVPAPPTPASQLLRAARQDKALALVSPAVLLALWEVLSRTGVFDARVLPAPTVVFQTLWELARDGELWTHIGYTAARFAAGMLLGTIPGIMLGLTMGMFKWFRVLVQPLVTIIYPLPRIALFPLFLILIGLNEKANIQMIALGPFFTMAISAMAAVLNLDPIYRDVADSYNTKPRDMYLRVMLPGALPVIMSGVHISMGLALMTTTAVEYLNAEQGLGYLIWHSWQILSLKLSLAALVAAGILGAIVFIAFRRLERHLIPWQTTSH